MEALRQLDILIPEQAIEVPKISSSPHRSRRRRVPSVHTAEQLVEVPTIVSYSSLHGLVEQNVDIPVPHGRRGRGGGDRLQGLRREQNSAAFCGAEHVDIPILHCRAGGGGLLGFSPRQISAASPAHSLGAAAEVFTSVFRTFPVRKKYEVGSALGVGTECGLYSVHAGGSSRRLLGG